MLQTVGACYDQTHPATQCGNQVQRSCQPAWSLVVLDRVTLVLAQSRVTQPGLVHPAINSFPNVSREVPVKGCAHTSIEDRVPEPPRNLVEVQPSRASRSVTSEVARPRACQIVLVFGTYNVFHFSGHHFKICPGSRLEALVLAWPTAARRSHQTAALC